MKPKMERVWKKEYGIERAANSRGLMEMKARPLMREAPT